MRLLSKIRNTNGREIPYRSRRKKKNKSFLDYFTLSEYDKELITKVVVVAAIIFGVVFLVYELIVNYKTIDTKITTVNWVDDWHEETNSITTCDGKGNCITTYYSDYYYRRTFTMSLANGMNIEFDDDEQVSSWDYKKNPSAMRTFSAGDCVRIGGYQLPWGFSVMNVDKMNCK